MEDGDAIKRSMPHKRLPTHCPQARPSKLPTSVRVESRDGSGLYIGAAKQLTIVYSLELDFKPSVNVEK